MIRLIINILVLVVLAVFISINVQYTTSVNFFGHKLEGISTIAVILISLAAGVIYSFFYYVMTFMAKSRKNKMKDKDKKTKEKAKELKDKEKNIKKHIEEEVRKASPEPSEPQEAPDAKANKEGSLLDRIKRKK